MAKKLTLTDKTPDELKEMLAEKRESLRQSRFASFGARTNEGVTAKATRKEIARVLTELASRKKSA